MNGGIPQPTALHRAALTLHAMPGADRQWLLDALSGEELATLRPLLLELEALGIPRDAGLSPALQGQAASGHDPAGALQGLDGEGVRRLAGMLRAEPPRLVAVLLSAGRWPWRDQLLAQLGVDRTRVDARPMKAGDAGALAAALLADLALGVHEAESTPAQPRGSRWQAVRSRMAILAGRA
jgi:hypothetical protein